MSIATVRFQQSSPIETFFEGAGESSPIKSSSFLGEGGLEEQTSLPRPQEAGSIKKII